MDARHSSETMDKLVVKVIKTPRTQNLVEEIDLLTSQKRDSDTAHERHKGLMSTEEGTPCLMGLREGFADRVTFE